MVLVGSAEKAKKGGKPAVKKPAAKAAVKKPAAKPSSKSDSVGAEIALLEKQAADLAVQLGAARKKIFANEVALRKSLSEKARLDDTLNSLLRASFAEEKALLGRVKGGAKRKESALKQEIASIERVAAIFEAKRQKVELAKSREAALRKQLEGLEKRAESLGVYG